MPIERDPIQFELYGSNESIDGPYELIASGDVVDFAGEAEWPRFTMNETPISFENEVAYDHYQILFPAVRGPGFGQQHADRRSRAHRCAMPSPR